MSATTQVTTFSDLYTDLQNRVRLQTSVTATENQAKRYINIALQDIHMGFGEKLPWCERTAVLRTRASYTTGTVSITNGSTTLTGASTVWTTTDAYGIANARAGGKINLGDNNIYEVSSVDSATSITLTQRYVGSTLAAGSSYTYFEDEYALASDFLRPMDMQVFSDVFDIDLVDRRTFRRAFPRNYLLGQPVVATIVDRAPSGNATPRRRVVFHKPPNEVLLIPYAYVTSYVGVSDAGVQATALSADTDEPLMPLRYRHIIVIHALYNWYRDKKDDVRSQEVKAEFVDLMNRMTGDHETGTNLVRLRPRVGVYMENARRPWGGPVSGRWTVGGAFDELRGR